MMINPDKIREVIGTGGKVIQQIIADTGVKIDIDDDGTVLIQAVKICSPRFLQKYRNTKNNIVDI